MGRIGPDPAELTGAQRIVVVAAVIAASVAMLVWMFAFALSHLFDFGPRPRHHLKPIPIAATACPYVSAMHSAANAFQTAMPTFGIALDAHGRALTCRQTRTRLGRAANRFDASIAVSIPQFPAQLGYLLQVVRNDIHAGRIQLRAAHDGSDFWNRTNALFDHGQQAFGYAGDLVGHRCSVQLGADEDTMLYPFFTTTTSEP